MTHKQNRAMGRWIADEHVLALLSDGLRLATAARRVAHDETKPRRLRAAASIVFDSLLAFSEVAESVRAATCAQSVDGDEDGSDKS